MAIPYDARLGVHPQSAGFTDHDLVGRAPTAQLDAGAITHRSVMIETAAWAESTRRRTPPQP
jgi:hypothetical protein